MNALSEYVNLGLGALFLKEESYEKMREAANPVLKGLVFILLIAVVVALVSIVGKALEWSTTPDLNTLKNIVLKELQTQSWMRELLRNPEATTQFRQGYDLWWQVFGSMFGVNLLGSVLNVITSPISMLFQWLVYGVLAYLFARLLGGVGSLGQTLGCIALSFAPNLLGILQFFPYVQLGGLFIWALVCTYLGIKVSGRLSPARAFWATVLPFVLGFLLVTLFACVGVLALSVILPTGGSS